VSRTGASGFGRFTDMADAPDDVGMPPTLAARHFSFQVG
jgi:hypothetical protein